MAARPKTAAKIPPAGMTTLAPLSPVAEAAAELAEEAPEERVEVVEEEPVSVADESVAVAVELPVVEEPEEVARELVLELEP